MENENMPNTTKEGIDSKIELIKDQTNYTEEASKSNRRLVIIAILISILSLIVAVFK
ncbi:MAG TPA: hypothetical protein VK806_10570 [Bacteroidia bacterium]|jgi:hypothetical protein|nr:hypothetical protein [Bacteroidia bacterium]